MIANDQFRGRTAAGREPRHRAVQLQSRNPSTGALRVSNAYDYPPSPALGGLRRTCMGRRVLKVVEEYGGGRDEAGGGGLGAAAIRAEGAGAVDDARAAARTAEAA